MILSTCNRVEIAVACRRRSSKRRHRRGRISWPKPARWIREWVPPLPLPLRRTATPSATCSAWPPAWIRWWSASRRFSASSRPLTPWPRITASVSGFLDALLTRAFSVAKRVRSETEIGANAVSVSYAAVELAREIFGSLDEQEGDAGRGGQDVRSRGPPPASAAAHRRSSSPTGPAQRAEEMAQLFRRQDRRVRRAISPCCPRWTSSSPPAARRTTS